MSNKEMDDLLGDVKIMTECIKLLKGVKGKSGKDIIKEIQNE